MHKLDGCKLNNQSNKSKNSGQNKILYKPVREFFLRVLSI